MLVVAPVLVSLPPLPLNGPGNSIGELLKCPMLPEMTQLCGVSNSRSKNKSSQQGQQGDAFEDAASYERCAFVEQDIVPTLCDIRHGAREQDSGLLSDLSVRKDRFHFSCESDVAEMCKSATVDSLRVLCLESNFVLLTGPSVRNLLQTRFPDLAVCDVAAFALRTLQEIKTPGDEFCNGRNAGQVWRYLRAAQRRGLKHPMVLLTTYSRASLCWLAEHDVEVKGILQSKSAQRALQIGGGTGAASPQNQKKPKPNVSPNRQQRFPSTTPKYASPMGRGPGRGLSLIHI